MTLRDYTANVISASKVVPDGNFKDSKASGVWDINEALDLIKGGNWPNAANFNPAAFVDALFSVDVYTGTGSSQQITNSLDLSGKGGLVWTKTRDSGATNNHNLQDTVNGVTKYLQSNNNNALQTRSDLITSFNSNGFTLGADASLGTANFNGNGGYVAWSWRKQPKFFDIVTYTGDGTSPRNISHSLGSQPGMMIVKRTSSSEDWTIYHRSLGATKYLTLNSTNAEATFSQVWGDTEPTSTQFSVGNTARVNTSGQTYIAYLFAHNNSDGGFGEPGDQDIIKCGTYTGNGNSNGTVVTLGFEPQFIMLKRTDNTENANWYVFDNIRGITNDGDDSYLYWNTTAAEVAGNAIKVTPTGFQLKSTSTAFNGSSATYIYMAIRRGGMQTPTAASSVFAIDGETDTSPTPPTYNSGFPVDLFLGRRDVSSSGSWYVFDRLRGNTQGLITNTRDAEQNLGGAVYALDRNDGVGTYTGTSYPNAYGWMWKRARGYFDMVMWNVDGTGLQTINHNLGVAPEMIWSKNLDDSGSGSGDWWIGHTGLTGWDGANENDRHALKFTNAASVQQGYHKNLTATSMQLGGNAVGGYTTSHQGIAYLFATVAGVSKIGSYTGNGNDGRVIDCGFTSGASFVLIKRSDGTGNWMVFDSARGIVSGNDPFLKLNATSAETTTDDKLDPDNSGFIVNHSGASINNSGDEYIFYAIAATS